MVIYTSKINKNSLFGERGQWTLIGYYKSLQCNFCCELLYSALSDYYIREIQHERDNCINNLTVSSKNADYIKSIKSQRDRLIWQSNKSSSQERIQSEQQHKLVRGSLDNVSRISQEDQSTLRRTRSFALSKENLFYSLNYTETTENYRRRAQLIPRAKLIEKSFVKDSRYESLRVESYSKPEIPFLTKPQEIPPDYSPLPTKSKNCPNEENIYDTPPVYTSRNNSPLSEYKDFVNGKVSDTSRYRKSLQDLAGLSLPRYYPDSEFTDQISLTDNLSTLSRDKSQYVSLDNLPWNIIEQPESISYDENIVLTKKTEGLYAKPKTIRGPNRSFDYEKLPQFSLEKKSDSNNEQHSSIEFETNTNCDEIKLNNENISKEENDEKHSYNDIIDKLKIKVGFSDKEFDNIEAVPDACGSSKLQHADNEIKSLLQASDYKSIVSVDEDKSADEAKTHSHNYLKEFLESQKGSKRPLQSFIAKKFSNLTRKKSNLVANQFYSLPDITASKNLYKCEKIDRKLRKCEKLEKVSENNNNRFIVNIGKYFDITAQSSRPVDFQVKIAKINKKDKKQKEKEFQEAVKNVNSTLQNNGFSIDLNNNNLKLEIKTMDPEIQEKVDNMRTYWTKMTGAECENEKIDAEKEPPLSEITNVKVNNVKKKFEPIVEETETKSPNKVQLVKQLFEPKLTPEKVEKISPTIKETCNYFEKSTNNNRPQSCYESLCSNAVELIHTNNKNKLTKSNSISIPEFDHVRYKVIKPELFNKKVLANCETESQFEGLMQYLQDYSFQELLIDNNIVIIEPIRSKIVHQNSKTPNKNIPKINQEEGEFDDVKQGIRKHFFYHPIRVNKEVNDDELPNPEVVRQARQFFEKVSEIKSKENLKEVNNIDPDKDKCSTSTLSDEEDNNNVVEDDKEEIYDSLDCCNNEYVSEDILEKIREYGTTVTYYGGQVVNHHSGQPILTKVIMEEIKNNEKRCMECSSCRRRSVDKTLSEINNEYQGIKFKLVKSNSCSSRLELVGAARKKKSNKTNNFIKEFKQEGDDKSKAIKGTVEFPDKNAINENIKLSEKLSSQPRIIGEERKMPDGNKYIQWSEIKNEEIKLNGKASIKNYHYQEKVASSKRNNIDMEFESYEVA